MNGSTLMGGIMHAECEMQLSLSTNQQCLRGLHSSVRYCSTLSAVFPLLIFLPIKTEKTNIDTKLYSHLN